MQKMQMQEHKEDMLQKQQKQQKKLKDQDLELKKNTQGVLWDTLSV